MFFPILLPLFPRVAREKNSAGRKWTSNRHKANAEENCLLQGMEKDLLFFLTEQHDYSVVEFDSLKGTQCNSL
jgi:hypothetical protein